MEAGGHITRVTVQARDFWCEGNIVVPRPGGYKGRVLDLLNESKEFLALTDVLLYRTVGGHRGTGGVEGPDEEPVAYDVLLLRRNEIQFVIPVD